MSVVPPTCGQCGETVLPQDKFCEACGHALTTETSTEPSVEARSNAPPADGTTESAPAPAPAGADPIPPAVPASAEGNCSFCGEPICDEFCTGCGAQRKFPERDRVEQELPGIAGVSDRGRRHTRNEDSMRFAVVPEQGAFVAIVCDGMSTAQNSDIASQRACEAACAYLVEAVQTGTDLKVLEVAMLGAAQAAQDAVCSVLYNKEEAQRNERRAVPACSFTAAVAVAGQLVIGNIGDSRSYYVGKVNVRLQLNDDDSWAADQVRQGNMSETAAMAHPDAHRLIQWLGADNQPVCGVKSFEIAEDGHLLLVSDGFWNYAMAPEAVADLVRKQPRGATPLQVASALTQFANEKGGRDNITVVVVPLSPRS